MRKIVIFFVLALLPFLTIKAHVTLASPLGGEILIPGSTVNIQWTEVAHDTENWDIFYSSDGGATWDTIMIDLPYGAPTLDLDWSVPTEATEQGMIRIRQDNNTTQDYEDTSAVFTIETFLPISLSHFSVGLHEQSSVQINWQTSNEIGNERFEIQRSSDDINYHSIASVPGAHFSNEEINYSYIDKSPLLGTNYYRLSSISTEGASEYSAVQTISLTPSVSFGPNPTQGNLWIWADNKNEAWQITGMDGQVIQEILCSRDRSASMCQTDISHLMPGTYILREKKSGKKGNLLVKH